MASATAWWRRWRWPRPTGWAWLSEAQIPHRYRHTELPPGGVVTRVRFAAARRRPRGLQEGHGRGPGLPQAHASRCSQPNFGSVFTNPPGDYAGRLIETVGLKGHVIGRAQVSTLHANWIVNLGGATAHDVLSLLTLMQTRVREERGVELQPEVKRVGVFQP